jgi:DNA-binding NarL/FixJ family response regulator
MSKISVLLVDDHVILRAGLRALLETYPDIEVVGEASDGERGHPQGSQAAP